MNNPKGETSMKYIKSMICLAFFISLCLPILSFAGNKVQLLPLEPLPQELAAKPYEPMPKPSGYNKRGRIDSIRGNEIVINDALRFLTSSTRFYSSSKKMASKRILKPGKIVVFELNKKNQIRKIRIENKK